MKELADWLKKRRAELDLTQEDVAAAARVRMITISRAGRSAAGSCRQAGRVRAWRAAEMDAPEPPAPPTPAVPLGIAIEVLTLAARLSDPLAVLREAVEREASITEVPFERFGVDGRTESEGPAARRIEKLEDQE